MNISNVVSAVILSVLSAFAMPAQAVNTVIELVNSTNSDESLINANTSGLLLPAAPGPLHANDRVSIVSTTGKNVDAGVITYSACRFNWSVIKIESNYQFSDGAIPSSHCESQVVYQNFNTGEYSVQFKVK